MISPTLRSRFAQPSSRAPMPGANESSTVLWQSAHVMPTDSTLPSRFVKTRTPTTALSLSSASVVAGSSSLARPDRIAPTTDPGSARASTLSPSSSAAFGLRPGPTPPFFAPAMASCKRNAPPQKSSSPNVSKRKVLRPFAICCAACCQTSAPAVAGWSRSWSWSWACAPPIATKDMSAANAVNPRAVTNIGRSSFLGRSLTSDPGEDRADDRVAALPAESERIAYDVVELAVQLLLQHAARAVKACLDGRGLDVEQLRRLCNAELLDAAQDEDLPKLLGQPIDGRLQDSQQVAARRRVLGLDLCEIRLCDGVLLGVDDRRRATNAAERLVDRDARHPPFETG